jgi:hypothetical protein
VLVFWQAATPVNGRLALSLNVTKGYVMFEQEPLFIIEVEEVTDYMLFDCAIYSGKVS